MIVYQFLTDSLVGAQWLSSFGCADDASHDLARHCVSEIVSRSVSVCSSMCTGEWWSATAVQTSMSKTLASRMHALSGCERTHVAHTHSYTRTRRDRRRHAHKFTTRKHAKKMGSHFGHRTPCRGRQMKIDFVVPCCRSVNPIDKKFHHL